MSRAGATAGPLEPRPLRLDGAVRAVGEPFWSPDPIVGYRMWHHRVLDDGEWRGGANVVWDTHVMRAHCLWTRGRDAPHVVADGACKGLCGVNAYATPEALLDAVGIRLAAPRSFVYQGRQVGSLVEALFGAVAMSGRVVEHEDGYRAENARVIALVRRDFSDLWATNDPDVIAHEFADGRSDYQAHWTRIELPDFEPHPSHLERSPYAPFIIRALTDLVTDERSRRTR